MMMKENLRIDEVSEILSCSARTVYRLVQEGELLAFKIRSSLRVPRAELDLYVRRQIEFFQESEGTVTASPRSDCAPLKSLNKKII
ncbi:MAG: helix-turn-helix domain-containing protein [Thermodesulfobacteriota bacterium]|nr:helix-turn-helix domain-containing protein [Thermodesulfobacteriota bacterium]